MVATAYKRSPQVGFVALGTLPGGGGGSGPVAAATALQALLTNGDAGAHAAGDLVYLSAAGTVRKAIPNGTAQQAQVYAMALGAVAPGVAGYYVTWGQVSGLAGGAFGALGFLSATSVVTTTVPSTPGQYSTLVGSWQSVTVFFFQPTIPLGPL